MPSDYMIQRMIENDLLAEINLDNIPNIKNMDPTYMEQSKSFDPKNKYSVPYCVGTVGILYNKSMVKEPVDSWDILWNPKYKDSILMQDSVRDAFAVALKTSWPFHQFHRGRPACCRCGRFNGAKASGTGLCSGSGKR